MRRNFPRWLTWPLALAATAQVALAALAAHAAPPPAVAAPDVVLVHGAFADGSSWSRVIPLLLKKGYHVTAVQLPLTSLADDVAATRRVIQRQPGRVLLVGHSWGGVVVTEAGNEPAVQGLVYLSALVPDSGESAGGLLQRLAAPMEGLTPDAAGFIWLDDPQAFHDVMGGDLPLAAAKELATVQKPIAARSFADAVSHAAWRDKPSWYLVTETDHALPPRVQRLLAEQLKARTVSIGSSHLSMARHPARVAELIDRAAREVGR